MLSYPDITQEVSLGASEELGWRKGVCQQDLLTKGLFSRVKQFGQEVQEREGEFKIRKKKNLSKKRKSIIFQLR